MAVWQVQAQFDGATWTDISSWCLSLKIARGRSDDLDYTEAGELTVELDNRDGRFTPENTQGTYVSGGVSQVVPGVPVRARVKSTAYSDTVVTFADPDVTYVGEWTSMFVGEVVRWRPEWGASSRSATVVLEATDGFEKLRQVELEHPLREQAEELATPVSYWPMDEKSGSTVRDVAGSVTLRPIPNESGDDAITIGATAIASGSDASVSATRPASGPNSWLEYSGTIPSEWEIADGDLAVFCLVRFDSPVGALYFLRVQQPDIGSSNDFRFSINGAGELELSYLSGGSAQSQSTSGLTWVAETDYLVGMWWDQSADQVSFVQISGSGTTSSGPHTFGGSPDSFQTGSVVRSIQNFDTDTIRVSDLLVYDTVADSATFESYGAALWNASKGHASDSPSERIGRLLDWAGWPSMDRSIDTGTTPLAALDADNVLTGCQEAAAADGGVFYISKSGDATFQGRRGRWEDDSAVVTTFDDDGTDVGYGFVGMLYDTVFLHNAVTVDSNTQGTSDGFASDATSQASYGVRSLTISTISNNTADNAERAVWEVSRRKDPHFRPDDLEFVVGDDIQQSAAADLELQDVVTFIRSPGAGQDDISLNFRVGEMSHQVSASEDSWVVKLGLTEADTDQPGVYGTAVYDTDYYGY